MFRWCLLTWLLLLLVEVRTAKQRLVFGGSPVRADTHKYMVMLVAADSKSLCSGTILDSMTILTAAHCFNRYTGNYSVMHFNNGEFNKIADVSKDGIIKHPKYTGKSDNRNDDLAIMKTDENIQFDDCIQPIGLARDHSVQVSDKVVVVGFGRSEPAGRPSARAGNLTVTNCPRIFQKVICTLDFVRVAAGDSGGALVFRERLVGVTSGSCVNADQLVIKRRCLSVFANVTSNIEWITSYLDEFITTDMPTTTSEETVGTPPPPPPPQRAVRQKYRTKLYSLSQHTNSLPPIYRNQPEEGIYTYLPIYYEDDISRTNYSYEYIDI